MSSRTEALLKGSHLRPTRLAASPCKNLFAVGGMTLQKSQTTRHVPLAGGGMTLQIGWRHDPAKITKKWRHEPANWHTVVIGSAHTSSKSFSRDTAMAAPVYRAGTEDGRQPSSSKNCSTVRPPARMMLRKVPRSSVPCIGTVSGARPSHSSRTWLSFWRTIR